MHVRRSSQNSAPERRKVFGGKLIQREKRKCIFDGSSTLIIVPYQQVDKNYSKSFIILHTTQRYNDRVFLLRETTTMTTTPTSRIEILADCNRVNRKKPRALKPYMTDEVWEYFCNDLDDAMKPWVALTQTASRIAVSKAEKSFVDEAHLSSDHQTWID